MADVFISYARADEPVARRFAEALGSAGLDVWWDDALRSGEVFDQAIEAALRAAKAVVVLWSPHSVNSRWVRAEATLADRNKTMVPVTIAACERPIIFELMHTRDLSGWSGSSNDSAWQSFVDEMREAVSRSAAASPAASSAAGKPQAEPVLDQTSIVVLPFDNMSRDEDQEYFADGITEDVITDLSKVSALGVVARNTAFTFKGQAVDIGEVARRLNVTHVVEGSVRKAGNRVRVTAQLIDGSTGNHLWADRWDRNLDDIFELQDELSQAIVEALKLKLVPSEKKAIETRGTDNVEAYDIYLRAQELSRSFAPADARRALELYHKALELDPDFTLALHGLGYALTRAMLNAAGDPEVLQGEREEVFERQMELAPNDWQTQIALASQLGSQFRMQEMEEALLKAKATAPASESRPSLHYSIVLFATGRLKDTLECGKAMLRMEPLSIEASVMIQQSMVDLEMDAEAEREYDRSKDLPGNRGIIEFFRFLDVARKGDMERTQRQLALLVQHDSIASPVIRDLGPIFDQPDKVRKLIRSQVDKPDYQQATHQSTLSLLACLFGDTETAMVTLRRSYIDLRSTARVQGWHPLMAKVRQDPRFKQLMRDTGVYDYWRATGNWGDFARPVGDDDFEIIR